jgi:hypothetical protein
MKKGEYYAVGFPGFSLVMRFNGDGCEDSEVAKVADGIDAANRLAVVLNSHADLYRIASTLGEWFRHTDKIHGSEAPFGDGPEDETLRDAAWAAVAKADAARPREAAELFTALERVLACLKRRTRDDASSLEIRAMELADAALAKRAV